MNEIKGHCSNPECQAHVTGKCYEDKENLGYCSKWITDKTITTTAKRNKSNSVSTVEWTGEALSPDTLNKVSQRSNVNIIASVGNVGAGKTSYLGMLYLLLLNGYRLDDYHFAGSYTITAWEKLADKLRFKRGDVEFPQPTPSNPDYYHLLHLALKREYKLYDIILADASGEVFKLWADNKDDENAENARWIHSNANAFLLFIDCYELESRKAAARAEIMDIANRLAQDLEKRPVAVVWSKADRINSVHEKIKEYVKERLNEIFGAHYKEFEVTNYPNANPEELCHGNNLKTLNWLLSCSIQASGIIPMVDTINKEDIFLNYR
jgi:hypothetical protein